MTIQKYEQILFRKLKGTFIAHSISGENVEKRIRATCVQYDETQEHLLHTFLTVKMIKADTKHCYEQV